MMPPDPATAGRAERPRLSNTGAYRYLKDILERAFNKRLLGALDQYG